MRLKELRAERNLYQKDIASMLGIDRTTYAKYETGDSEPNFETLKKIAEIFNVTTDYLLGRTEQKEAPIPDSEDGLSEPERHLVVLYRDLNNEGQEKLIDYADDLVSSGKYIKSDSSGLGKEA